MISKIKPMSRVYPKRPPSGNYEAPVNQAKYAALEEWVSAVNQRGGFGLWKSAISLSTTDVVEQIAAAVTA
jgi:hypothetical protein